MPTKLNAKWRGEDVSCKEMDRQNDGSAWANTLYLPTTVHKRSEKIQLNVRSLSAFNIEFKYIYMLYVLVHVHGIIYGMCSCTTWKCTGYLTIENVLNACFTFNLTVYRAFYRNGGKFSECIILDTLRTKRIIIRTDFKLCSQCQLCLQFVYTNRFMAQMCRNYFRPKESANECEKMNKRKGFGKKGAKNREWLTTLPL